MDEIVVFMTRFSETFKSVLNYLLNVLLESVRCMVIGRLFHMTYKSPTWRVYCPASDSVSLTLPGLLILYSVTFADVRRLAPVITRRLSEYTRICYLKYDQSTSTTILDSTYHQG